MTRKELTSTLRALTPVRVSLDAHDRQRYVELNPPSRVELRADDAVYVETTGKVAWEMAGLPLPFTLRSVRLRVVPAIEVIDGQQSLTLLAQVDRVDLSALPGLVEVAVIGAVNAALRERRAKAVWRFTRTLDFTLRLPSATEPRRQVRLHAVMGSVRVTADGLVAAVTLRTRVQVMGARERSFDHDALARWVDEGGAGNDPVRSSSPRARLTTTQARRHRRTQIALGTGLLAAIATGTWLHHAQRHHR